MRSLGKLLIVLFILFGCDETSSSSKTLKSSTDHIKKTEGIMSDSTPKVTGIGGIFFRSSNPDEMRTWYGKNLGLAIDDYGSPFEFRNANRPEEINYLRWSPFEEGSEYFAPSEKEFMINYRVQNIDGLVKKLREAGVTIVDEIVK